MPIVGEHMHAQIYANKPHTLTCIDHKKGTATFSAPEASSAPQVPAGFSSKPATEEASLASDLEG